MLKLMSLIARDSTRHMWEKVRVKVYYKTKTKTGYISARKRWDMVRVKTAEYNTRQRRQIVRVEIG